jgi:RNA polymerase sigma-70 factor (ECF subfamily)
LIERRCIVISDIELLELLNNNPDRGLKMMMDNYMALIYTIVFNKLSDMYSKEDIEECVSDVFFEVFHYKSRIDLHKGSIKSFLAVVAKRKAIDMYRKNKNKNHIPIDDVSEGLFTEKDDVVHTIILKESNSELIDAIKSLGEPDSEIILRRYYLLQSSKDISKNIGLKVNTIDKKVSRGIQKLKKLLGGIT